MRVVITGTSRGLGAELARQFLARGDTVVAGVRNPRVARAEERLTTLRCDVADDESVRQFARAAGGPIDVLINNAGVSGTRRPLGELDTAELVRVVDVNAAGALRVTRALLPELERARARVLNVTSRLGSIAETSGGGSSGAGNYAYKMSKAALNMATRCLAAELAPRGIVVACVHPGWVRTDMGGPSAPLTPEDSARALLALVDGLDASRAGRFLDWQGAELPW
jgi:NAD(P)-dependent dehydrogenase (short-subunit alcohol dehydrogenase family)